jgi:hypothetical protein
MTGTIRSLLFQYRPQSPSTKLKLDHYFFTHSSEHTLIHVPIYVGSSAQQCRI